MLDENRLNLMSYRFYERIQEVNTVYLEAIGKRFAQVGEMSSGDITRLARLTAWQSADIKLIETQLAKAMSKNISEVQEALEIIAEDNLEFAKPYYAAKSAPFVSLYDNVAVMSIVNSMAADTKDTFKNLTSTSAVSKVYNSVLDDVILKAQLGHESYLSASRQAIREVTASGLHVVDYESGYKRRIDTSVRQNILYGMKQVNIRSSEEIGRQFGNDGWEISYHSNPRPSHRAMGGQQYTLKEFANSDAKDRLNDFACLHYKYPIVIGVSQPTHSQKELAELKAKDAQQIVIDGEKMSRYDASQIQRKLESEIRKQKDIAVMAKAANDMDLRRQVQGKINLLNRQYTDLSKQADLPTHAERLTVASFRQVKAS